MEEPNTVTNVVQAILAVLDWNSAPHTRKAAVAYLESLKSGDIRVLANTSVLLVKKDWSSEIRVHALKLMQHLVRLRWDELNPTERRDFTNVAVGLLSEIADPCELWALKSQTAALIAEIVRREGLNLWQELLPLLVSLSASGPVQAELVSMILRWLPEDITVHNEDLEGDRRRLLLRGLTESLPEILPLLYSLVERHFRASLSEAGKQHIDIAKQHAAAVTSTVNAVNAYAEWAPLNDLLKFGIIHSCNVLLSRPDFRLHACEFFKLVSSRKRPLDAASEFDSAMSYIFQVLMNISKEFLNRTESGSAAIEESEFEFAELICESMVSLGSLNLKCISGDNAMLLWYLRQMLGYFQHFKFALHYQSLLFWLALFRDLLSKPKSIPHAASDSSINNLSSASKQADDGKMNVITFLDEESACAMLEVSFQRLLKKERVCLGTEHFLGGLELWSDDFEGKGEFGQYRSRLIEFIRFVACSKPLLATAKVSEKVLMIINAILLDPTSTQNFAVMESMHLALEIVLSAVYDGSTNDSNSDLRLSLDRIIEGLLQQLLSLRWSEPTFVELLGHYLVALGPFLKYHTDAAGRVINKLFELLNSLPFVVKDPSTSTARHARLQICTSFIRIAKAAGESLLPHMKAVADTVSYLQGEGGLLRGEHNLLGEAFLIMASAAGVQQQQEVLVWLLEPLSKQWIQIEWQNEFLSNPNGLVRLCSQTKIMWSIFHTVTFFEKALKRSGLTKGHASLSNTSPENSVPYHPLASHLSWMLPPLLKLLRAIHSLWSPAVSHGLPGEIKAAMVMSDVERTNLLGEGNLKLSKSELAFTDGSQFDMNKEGSVEPNETDIRNWLKGIRDSGYNVLGLSTTIGDSFYKTSDVYSVALALVENVQSMEFRHMRQLLHSIYLPLIKCCPSDMWDVWLEKLLHPIFLYSQQALCCSWSSFLQHGRTKVPDNLGIPASSDLKVEVMEEKLLRDLTREICVLLSALASPGLNTGLPSLEQSGHVNRPEVSALKDLDTFSSSSMIGFVLKHKGLALLALQIILDTFKWGDSESLTKVSSFCGSVVLLAVLSNNVELREFVAKDLFYAIILSLEAEANVNVSAELVNLCREIFVYLSDRDPAPRQILLSLPFVTPQDLLAFEEALSKTSSPKEQKQHMRSLLLLATGNKLKALANPRNVNVITNVSARPRNVVPAPESRTAIT